MKNILVPVDGSPSFDKAVKQAINLAKLSGAKLNFLNVTNAAAVAFDSSINEEVMEAWKNASAAILDRIGYTVPKGIEYKKISKIGSPAEIILEYEDFLNADLIVMGSRGLGIIKSFLLGSVSQYIVERAKCPVMIVK